MLLSNMELLATAPGGVAKLRELILTLAVQGKLVPQDPADEPAGVLLQKIRAEKDRLIAEGKIKRDKPLAEIAEEEKPFELPQGWEWVRFGEIAGIERGGSPRPIEAFLTDDPEGLNWIKIGDTEKGGKYITSAGQKIKREGLVKTRMVFPGDFLLTNSMSFGRPYITQIQGCIHDGWLRISPPDSLDKDFLYTLLSSRFVRNVFEAAAAGGVVLNLNADKVRTVPIPLPPLPEQSRIVTRVEALMRLCDALEAKGQLEAAQHAQLVSTLLGTLTASTTPEELAANWQRVAQHFDLLLDRPEAIDALEQTLLQLAVRGLLVPQDPTDEPASALLQKIRAEKDRLIATGQIKRDKPLPPITDEEKPFELPVGWEWVRLGFLLKKIGAGSTPLGGREVYVSSGVKFLRSQNVWDDGLRLDGVAFIKPEIHAKMAGTVVSANDLLFNITGASIGRCAVVPSDFDEANVSQHVTIIRAVQPELNAFLHKVLVSRHVQQTVMAVQVGVSREGLSITKLGQFLIPVPPLAEQSRIVTRVAALRRLCADLRQRLAERQSVQARLAEALVGQAGST